MNRVKAHDAYLNMNRAPTEMELRVAGCLATFHGFHGPKNALKYLSLARAAICAMREPTPDMDAKLRTIVMDNGPFGKNWYVAAIDAASPQEE